MSEKCKQVVGSGLGPGACIVAPGGVACRHPTPKSPEPSCVRSSLPRGLTSCVHAHRSVGVQGDQRTHSSVVALRAVTSSDGMTADWYPFEPRFLQTVSSRICNGVRSVNRVVYDITSKPPGTIEWE